MKHSLLLATLVSLTNVLVLEAADFVKVPIPGMQPHASWTPRSVAWGDYDNDGDLDFIQNGEGVPQLWRNDRPGFTAVEIPGMPNGGLGFVAWVDVDNDGRLDLLHSALLYDSVQGTTEVGTDLWQNTGTGFVRKSNTGLPAVFDGDVACADFDLDGRTDLLLVGSTTFDVFPGEYLAGIWRNVGGRFEQTPIPGLLPFEDGRVAAADFDGDGRPDFVVSGLMKNPNGTNTLTTQLWRNTTNGFVRVAVPGLTPVSSGQVTWADFDRNGRPDLLITGLGVEAGFIVNMTFIWLNTEAGFRRVNIPGFPRDLGRAVASLDYDNDGWTDFMAAGAPGVSTPKTQLWRNQGTNYIQASLLGVPRIGVGCLAAADYDNDGRTDFLLQGFGGSGVNLTYYAELWRNTNASVNVPPSAPTGLVAESHDGVTTLRWQPATDDHSPELSLTYNVRVSTQPGGIDIVSPHSDPQTGYRRVPEHGNASWRTYTNLKLPPGTYFASVQAVDVNYTGGPFSGEIVFSIPPRLNVVRQGDKLVVSWTEPESGYVLESSTSLEPASWQPEPSGSTSPVLIAPSETQRFFRLRKP